MARAGLAPWIVLPLCCLGKSAWRLNARRGIGGLGRGGDGRRRGRDGIVGHRLAFLGRAARRLLASGRQQVENHLGSTGEVANSAIIRQWHANAQLPIFTLDTYIAQGLGHGGAKGIEINARVLVKRNDRVFPVAQDLIADGARPIENNAEKPWVFTRAHRQAWKRRNLGGGAPLRGGTFLGASRSAHEINHNRSSDSEAARSERTFQRHGDGTPI